MKTKLLTLALLLAGGSYSFAENIEVSPSTYINAITNASDGDILLLNDTEGSYTSDFKFPSGKTITLKAAQGANPILTMRITADKSATDGGLIFDGVTIDRNNSAQADFINVTMKNINIIAFRNSTIKQVYRSTIATTKVDDFNTIGKIEFDNCIVVDCDRDKSYGYNFIWTQHGVEEVVVKNSTLYNYSKGESFFCVNGISYPDNVLNFLFENNTIYKWGKDGTRAFAKIENYYNAASTYTFRNNIIAEPGVTQLPMIADVTNGTIVGENNLVVNYGGYNGGTQTINDITLADLGLTEIGFLDPANGNFTITADSPIATAGTNGGPIGDPRWITNITEFATLITTCIPQKGGTTFPETVTVQEGAGVTVNATANFGYRFHEWQDTEGNSVSTQNPYTFDLMEDTELVAVFELTTTFITAWNFVTSESQPTVISGYVYDSEDNKGVINMYSYNGATEWMSISDQTFGGITHKAPRRWTSQNDLRAGNSRYFQVKFIADGYENIKISSLVAADNDNVFKTQVLQYSTDGENFVDALNITIEEKNKWYEMNIVLPKVTGEVYIRWTSNNSNGFVNDIETTNNTEGFYLGNVAISADKISPTSYTRDCYVDGAFETICLPFDVTAITNGSGEEVTPTLYQYNSHTSGSDQVGFVPATVIAANTPYLIAFPEDTSIDKLPFTFAGTEAAAASPAKQAGSYAFTGTYSKFSSADNYYVLNNAGDGFVRAAATTFVAAYRAYLAPVDNAPAPASQLNVVFDNGGATAIEPIAPAEAQSLVVYTIDGRFVGRFDATSNCLQQLDKGFYIVNNQKLVVQ